MAYMPIAYLPGQITGLGATDDRLTYTVGDTGNFYHNKEHGGVVTYILFSLVCLVCLLEFINRGFGCTISTSSNTSGSIY